MKNNNRNKANESVNQEVISKIIEGLSKKQLEEIIRGIIKTIDLEMTIGSYITKSNMSDDEDSSNE